MKPRYIIFSKVAVQQENDVNGKAKGRRQKKTINIYLTHHYFIELFFLLLLTLNFFLLPPSTQKSNTFFPWWSKSFIPFHGVLGVNISVFQCLTIYVCLCNILIPITWPILKHFFPSLTLLLFTLIRKFSWFAGSCCYHHHGLLLMLLFISWFIRLTK